MQKVNSCAGTKPRDNSRPPAIGPTSDPIRPIACTKPMPVPRSATGNWVEVKAVIDIWLPTSRKPHNARPISA